MATKTERERLASPDELAEHLGVTVKTLAQWRYLGTGPKFTKAGRSVRYRWADIDAWLKTRDSTR